MRIACIAADLQRDRLGGAEVHAVEVIKRLAKNHQITVFVGKDTTSTSLFPKNVTVVPISYPQIPNLYGVSYNLFGFPQIKKYLEDHPTDLIWAKQCFPQAIVGNRLKQALHKPLYITAQNPYLLTEELVVKGKLLQPLQTMFALLMNAHISHAFKAADCVAAVSQYSKKASKAFGAKTPIIIPNGYDPLVMKPSAKKKNNVFTIVTTSSLIPRNGIDTLIKAVNLLPAKLPWQLLIAGDGPERQYLESVRANNNSPQQNIHFLGRVANQKIPDLVKHADLFVRPSRWEGFGVSFVEAMACGVPIIGTMVGGIPDFLIPDKTGLAVPVDNVTALTHAITKLMTDQKLRQTLSENALEFVSSHYRWDTIAAKVESTMLGLITQDSTLKTLIISPIYPPEIGGPATYVPEVAKRLHATVIAFSNHFSSDKFVSTKGNALTRQSKLLFAVWKQLKHHDTLYIQGTIVVGLSAFIGRMMGKRVIIKFVGDEVWEASHSSKSLEDFYQSNPHSLLLFIHRSILKAAHQVVVPSQYLKDFLVKYHGLHQNHVSIIPNATEIINPPTTKKKPNQLIFVGRLVSWKHVNEIIRAVEIARKTNPWKLVIVGDGPEKSHLPTPSFVTYTGQIPKQKTLEHVAQSKALILYSSYEGHPHTVLEAHALGVTTIVSDIDPHQDLGSFAKVRLHNPTALAKAINSLKTTKIAAPPTPPSWSDHIEKLMDVLTN